MPAYKGLIIFLEDLETWLSNVHNWQTKEQIQQSKNVPSILSQMWQLFDDPVVNFDTLAKHNFEIHQIMLITSPSKIFSESDVWNSYFDMLELIIAAIQSDKVPVDRLSDTTIKIIRN